MKNVKCYYCGEKVAESDIKTIEGLWVTPVQVCEYCIPEALEAKEYESIQEVGNNIILK